MAPHESGGAEHGEILELLPWYANGSLEGHDRARVEAHLGGCALCRRELEECRDLSAAVKSSPPPTPAPHPGSLERLLARVDETEAQAPRFAFPRRRAAWGRSLSRGLATRSPWWRRLALAQAVALVALGVTLARRPEPPPPAAFRTLASAPSAAPTSELRVAFSEALTEGELRRLLLPLSAQIVAGPSALGVYTLRVPTGATAEPLTLVVEHLSQQPGVRFVAAVPSGGP